MFEVCLDERSVSRLALVWLPDAQPDEPESDARAAQLLFTVLDRRDAVSAAPAPDKSVPAKPARRSRKRDSVRARNDRTRNARTQTVQTH